MRKGIALLSFGEPDGPKAAAAYVSRLRGDSAFLAEDRGFLSGLLRPWRTRSIAGRVKLGYEELARRADARPALRHWTIEQEKSLGASLGEDYCVRSGFHFGGPSIESALAALREWGAEEVVLFSLVPQFSAASAGSCFSQAHAVMQSWGWRPAIREILHWPDHAAFIQLMRERIALALEGDPAHVLFTAQSHPQKQSDLYPTDLARTVASLVRGLGHPWSIGFHSAISRSPKLRPYLEDELRRLSLGEMKRVLLVPLGFMSDHYETLLELDGRYVELARSLGFEKIERVEPFNGDPKFTRVLREVLVGNGVVPGANREAGK